MANSMSEYRQNGVDYIIDDPTIAPVFVATNDYSMGQYVKHEGNLYRFIVNHAAGAWNTSHVSQVLLGNEFYDLKGAFNLLTAKDIKSGDVIEITDFVKTSNAAWRINDAPVPGQEYYYCRYSINGEQKLFVTGRSWGAKYPLIAFYDASDNLLSTAGETSQLYNDYAVSVPANATYFYVNGATYNAPTVVVKTLAGNSVYDIMVSSEPMYVDACRENSVLMDADNAEINCIYRLYFRGGESIQVAHLPDIQNYSTEAVLMTFGEKADNLAFRAQILFMESNGIFFRYSSSIAYDTWHIIYDMRKVNYITISPTDDVIQKLIDANRDNYITDIYFDNGDYDVISLYERHFGSDFFNNYSGYNSGTGSFGRGLVLGNGKRYHFSDQALFHAEYIGSNPNVTTYFSMFAPEYGAGFVVDGLRITACSNLRYAVHADFSAGAYNGGTAEFRNCYLNTSDRCIGAGLYNGAVLKLIDSVFIQTSDIVPVHVHSPNTQGELGKLIVNGCYFSNRLQIGKGGSNTVKSFALVSNTSLVNLVNENGTWDVLSFNVERRT